MNLTCFIEEEGVLVLFHVLWGSGLIQEERVDPLNVLHLDFSALLEMNNHSQTKNACSTAFLLYFIAALALICVLALPGVCGTPGLQYWWAGWHNGVMSPVRYELKLCVPPHWAQRLPPHSCNKNTCMVRSDKKPSQDYILSNVKKFSPNLQDLSGLFLSVRSGCNDQQTVKHVYRNTMRTLVIGASNTVKMKHNSGWEMIHN